MSEMAEPIGGQEIRVRLAVILVGIILLIAPFSILPALGIYSAGYGGFLVLITGFLVVFFSLALNASGTRLQKDQGHQP